MNVMILGCGQLARLIALAGKKLDVSFTFVAIENESTDCIDGLGNIVRWNNTMSAQDLLKLTDKPDAVTVERENIDKKLLFELSLLCSVSPDSGAVATCQNRLKEKLALTKLSINTTPWLPVSDNKDLFKAVETFGLPIIIKAYENGYDGYNQWHINTLPELYKLIKETEAKNWIVEPKIDFIKEASLIGVRSKTGEVKFYPITENHHEKGILKHSIAPFEDIKASDLSVIKKSLNKLMSAWQYVGVMTMELFLTKDGFMVNELAPRVHNSGHWTTNSGVTCQFENHLRAILGLPLGNTQPQQFNGMINLLGNGPSLPKIEVAGAEVHFYGKLPRKGRKLGHINLIDSDRQSLIKRMRVAQEALSYSSHRAH